MSKLKDFVEANKDALISSIGIVGLAFICKKLGVSFNVPEVKYKLTKKETTGIPARNSVETAIAILVNNTKNMSWDYYKLDAAEKIMDILADNKSTIDDETKSFAIIALRAILSRLKWDSSKDDISNMITNIVSGEF